MIAIGMLSAGSGCDTVKPVSTTQEIPTAEETNLVTTAPVSEGEQPAETTTVPQIADVLTTAATTPKKYPHILRLLSWVLLLRSSERLRFAERLWFLLAVLPQKPEQLLRLVSSAVGVVEGL